MEKEIHITFMRHGRSRADTGFSPTAVLPLCAGNAILYEPYKSRLFFK
jgi:hypothetical protein